MVRATDPFRAVELIKSISLKNVLEIDNDNNDNWLVKFHQNVFIRVQARGLEQAKRAAEWKTYLDRRERRIVGAT
jgi:hypothetical protein